MRRTRIRWWLVSVLAVGQAVAYIDRANLGILAPLIGRDLGLDHAMMGVVLGAFYWSYSASQMPAGYAVDRLGIRYILPLTATLWSLANAATAIVSGLGALLAVRLCLGVAEAPLTPSVIKTISQWFPRQERAVAVAIVDAGGRIGTTLAFPTVAALAVICGWRIPFLVTGVLGLVWIPLWLWLYRDPRRHQRISPSELSHIEQGGARLDALGAPPIEAVPWASLFRYRTVWGLMIGSFCHNFINFWFVTWFPSYLVEARHFSLLAAGIGGLVPPLAGVFGSLLGGIVSDGLVRRGVGLTLARKSCVIGGLVGSSVIALAVFVPDTTWAIALMAFSSASIAFIQGSIWSFPTELAPTPHNVASIAAIQNTASQAAGFMLPVFVGVVLSYTAGSFTIPLFTAGAVVIFGALNYAFVVGPIRPLPILRDGPSVVRQVSQI